MIWVWLIITTINGAKKYFLVFILISNIQGLTENDNTILLKYTDQISLQTFLQKWKTLNS